MLAGMVALLMVGSALVIAVPGIVAATTAIESATASPLYESYYVGSSFNPASSPPGWCGALQCYTPQELQQGYNWRGAYGQVGGYANAGAGQTIVIFDAYGNPYIAANLAVFDATFGLPPAKLNIFCPQGCPKFDPSGKTPNSRLQLDWAGEISLDTQSAHAYAPAATLDLVIARSEANSDFLTVEQWALAHHLGNIWSQSFGEPECDFSDNSPWFAGNNLVYQEAVAQGITIFASAGDSWSQNGCPTPSASYPADNPNNIAVTGTYIDLQFAPGKKVSSPLVSAKATYGHETTWNDQENATLVADGLVFGGTGGAMSNLFPAPAYQSDPTLTPYTCTGATPSTCAKGFAYHPLGKVAADVAYDGSVNGGILGYMNFGPHSAVPAGYYIFGGTSAGSPAWSALIAIADQAAGKALGNIAPWLYAWIGSIVFHDITVGSNTAEPGTGFLSTTGWDGASGVGSPNVGKLVRALAAA